MENELELLDLVGSSGQCGSSGPYEDTRATVLYQDGTMSLHQGKWCQATGETLSKRH
jgi:hypothetical protein